MATKKAEDLPVVHRFEEPGKLIDGKLWLNGMGRRDARVMLVDTWPSEECRRKGKGFVDRQGAVLVNLLREAGINPKECYATYAVKFSPGKGKKPSSRDVKLCRRMLDEEIAMVDPDVIVAFGADAWNQLVNAREFPHGKCRGEPMKVACEGGRTRWLFPTFNMAQVMLNGGEYFKDRMPISQVPQHVLVHSALRELRLVKRLADGEDLLDTYSKAYPTYVTATTPEEVGAFREFLEKEFPDGVVLGLDCEWDGRNWLDPDRYFRTIQIGYAKGRALIVEVTTEEGVPLHPDHKALMEAVKSVLEHPLVGIVGHNVIADGEWLLQEGIDIRDKVVYDTMLGEYLLCEDGPFGLEECAMKYAPYGRYCAQLEMWVHRNAKLCRKGFGPVPRDILLPYGAADVDCLRYIMERQIPMIRELGYMERRGTEKEYPSVLEETLNTQRVLYEVEGTGLPVDKGRLDEMIDKFQSMRAHLLAQVVSGAAEVGMPEFNPGSPDQVRTLLFDKLGLPPVKTTAGKDWADAVGNYGMDSELDESAATDKQTLEILGDRHPLCHALLQFRRIDQYCKTWLRHVDPKNPERGIEGQMWADGRLHSHMSQLSTTSRFKSSSPNSGHTRY